MQALEFVPPFSRDDSKDDYQGFRPGFGVEFMLRGGHLLSFLASYCRTACRGAARLTCYDSPRLQQESLKLHPVDPDRPLANTNGGQLAPLDKFVGPRARDIQLLRYLWNP